MFLVPVKVIYCCLLWVLFHNAVFFVQVWLWLYLIFVFSFNMAHCYPDLAGDVDVISDSEVLLYFNLWHHNCILSKHTINWLTFCLYYFWIFVWPAMFSRTAASWTGSPRSKPLGFVNQIFTVSCPLYLNQEHQYIKGFFFCFIVMMCYVCLKISLHFEMFVK